MADLLTNPLLNTEDIVVATIPDGKTGQVMGDWYSNYNYKAYNPQYRDNNYYFDCILRERSGGEIFIPFISRDPSQPYKFYIRQDVRIDNFASYASCDLYVKINTYFKTLNLVNFDIAFNNGTTQYYYSFSSNSWVETVNPIQNTLIGSFNDTKATLRVHESSYNILQFPSDGVMSLIISAPFIISGTDVNNDQFYSEEFTEFYRAAEGDDYVLNKYSRSKIMEIVTCSITPTNANANPEIVGFSTTNDNGTANGSITITAESGTQPYEYSIDNITYQNSSVFDNLAYGNYTAYVKDANDLIDSKPFEIKLDISYKKRLYGQLGNQEGDTYKYEIHEANYTGEAQERDMGANGLSIKNNTQNDFLTSPIRGSSADVTIVAEEGDNYDSMISGSDRNAYIKITKNGQPFWYGWVMPVFFLEPYQSAPYLLKLSARDGLAEFGEHDFDDIDDYGVSVKGEIKIKRLFVSLLKTIWLGQDVYVDGSISDDSGIWFEHTINIDQYIDDNAKISDIVNDVLSSFSAEIRQVNGDWYITRVSSYANESLKYIHYDSIGNQLGYTNIDHAVLISSSKELVSTQSIQLQEPYRKIVIEQDYVKKEAANQNPSFENWDYIGNNTWKIKGWEGSSTGAAGDVFTGEEPKEVTLDINPIGNDIYLSQFVDNVEKDGFLKWTTGVKLLGDLDKNIPGSTEFPDIGSVENVIIQMQLILRGETNTYYFDASDGSWDLTEERINLINFTSESGAEEGYKISEALPENGIIECRIYRNKYISYECKDFIIEFLDAAKNTYNDKAFTYDTINARNRLTPPSILMKFSDVPSGSNSRLMYRGYIWDGNKTTSEWLDEVYSLTASLSEILSFNIAQLKKNPYRKFSGTIRKKGISPLNSVMIKDRLISSKIVGDTTTNIYLYRGYIFAGGDFDCYNSEWKGQWLERYQAQVTKVIIDEVPDPPVIEVIPSLLIDGANDLLIDDVNKLIL